MNVTSIYGLFDPRAPDVVMYVGKGLAKRAQQHWKFFLAKGTAVNALLRRWFERLQEEGATPSWRFLEENVADWRARERDLISTWHMVNPALCNMSSGGNEWPLTEATLIGRRLGGRIGGRRVHELQPESMAKAQSLGGRIGGRIGGRRAHERHPGLAAKMGRIGGLIGGRRVHELHPGLATKIGQLGGRIGTHNRWHLARGIVNPACFLCRNVDFFDIWEGQAKIQGQASA